MAKGRGNCSQVGKEGSTIRRYQVKSKKGVKKSRCLDEFCKRVHEPKFWYKRKDGHCGKIKTHMPENLQKEYYELRRNQRNKSRRDARKTLKSF